MAFDYKKEYKEFYMPKNKPSIVEVPPMNYIAVRGKGDPNVEDGEYKQSISLLYGIAFTIKMSKKGNHHIVGLFIQTLRNLPGTYQRVCFVRQCMHQICFSKTCILIFINHRNSVK